MTHQFYTGAGQKTETCDSEIFSVGGIDNVDVTPLLRFDYAALGHLHSAQKVGREFVRYPGTLLKYSVSECNQTKISASGDAEREGRTCGSGDLSTASA